MAFIAPPTRSAWASHPVPYRSLCPQCRRPISDARAPPTMRSKREKRSRAPSPTPSTPAAATPPPLRVDVGSSTLSVREQLKLARTAAAESAAASAGARPVLRTRFRRKKRAGFQSGEGGGMEDAAIPEGKYAVEAAPVVYIDGYNVVGAWGRLRKHRGRGDLETARRVLVDAVAEFAHVRGWECVVVFDANGSERGERRDVTRQEVEVVFTGGETADSYIERAVFERCEEGTRQTWAATSDVAQLRFSTAKGAHVMSAGLFVQELKKAKRETEERVRERDEGTARGKTLIANVDEDTRNALYALRDKLNGS